MIKFELTWKDATALVQPGGAAPAMTFEMKSRCEGCGVELLPSADAYVCSYECTYCDKCSSNANGICPNCGGEQARRPRRTVGKAAAWTAESEDFQAKRPWLIWIVSFVAWSFVAFLAALSVLQWYKAQGYHLSFGEALSMQFSQMLPFAPLTPFVFALAVRFPIRRENWIRRSVLYLIGGLVFTAAHISMRGITPYGFWDAKASAWHSAAWDYEAHKVNIQWHVFKDMFVFNAFDDITSSYLPILLIAYVVSYYWSLKDRERLTAQLEAQLVKSNLRALKSQLQPHFLFNTMHSISALMFTDVHAADKMMTRLSELLRMSLEDGTEQLTTLNRELEFVNGYLEIEKIRFGERLQVIVDVPSYTLDDQVPHLLLQPFVENAIQHGIARLSSCGTIRISSRHQGEHLYLKVKDNGPGFGTNSRPAYGLGIGTSLERLRALYGDNQGLEFATPPDGGAEVTIRIPYRRTFDEE